MERAPAYRTLAAKPTESSLIKPGELVDLVEMTPLTLNDRRIYNQLLAHAWERIAEPVEHVIAKRDLRGSHNANDRLGDSIERLMAAIVKVRVIRGGERAVERVQLLGSNTEHESPDGLLRYEFPARLRAIITESTIFARLQKEVMFALSSKYALALYEMVQKRGNLAVKSQEDFEIGASSSGCRKAGCRCGGTSISGPFLRRSGKSTRCPTSASSSTPSKPAAG